MEIQEVKELFTSEFRLGEVASATCARAMKKLAKLDPVEFDRLNEEAEKVITEVRRYGRNQFYSWGYHPTHGQLGDPWPSNRFPKGVCCYEIVLAECNQVDAMTA